MKENFIKHNPEIERSIHRSLLFNNLGGSFGPSNIRVVGGQFTLPSPFSNTMEFSADFPTSFSLKTDGKKEYRSLI